MLIKKNYCIMMFLLLTNILLVFIMYITYILLIMSHPLCYCVISVLIIIVNILITMMWNITVKKQSSLQMSRSLTLYPLTSVSIISLLFTMHFPRCWQREFVKQSRASSVGDHLVYSHDPYVWFKGDIVRRN